MELHVRNIREAYVQGHKLLTERGQWEDTRNGRALVLPEPLLTVYDRPLERVLFDPLRDANPFFHLMEGFWMLAGRNDVKSIGKYLGTLKRFSDDGETYHGAYGFRWRNHFWHPQTDYEGPADQLAAVIRLLRENPQDRRIVLTMWDPLQDLAMSGLDFPCNTHCYLRTRGNLLDLTICCRSNDMIWGAYGANAVHFSILLEFLAAASGLTVGRMYQLSNNFHAYEDVLVKVGTPAATESCQGSPLFTNCLGTPIPTLLRGLDNLWNELGAGSLTSRHVFLSETGYQTLALAAYSHSLWKEKRHTEALLTAHKIPAADWSKACWEWLQRRTHTEEDEVRPPCNVR